MKISHASLFSAKRKAAKVGDSSSTTVSLEEGLAGGRASHEELQPLVPRYLATPDL